MTAAQQAALAYSWRARGRPDQQEPPGDWLTWLALAGRGWGKTETGAQWIRHRVMQGAQSIALVAETQKDLEEVMVPRIIAVHPPGSQPTARFRPVRMSWPCGAQALGYVGNEPDQLRGPEFDTAWIDELAKYRYATQTWDMLQMTMRRGDRPRVFISTTPRPIPIIRKLMADQSVCLTRGRTADNALNLPTTFLDKMRAQYEGTRLGRQELEGQVLDDVPGALWTRDMIAPGPAPDLARVVVGVDPSGTAGGEGSDSVGIVAVGAGVDGRFYVLEDATCNLSPAGWARRVVEVYSRHKADRVVAEANFGGAMVESTLRTADKHLPVRMVSASRGKAVRAEPIAALYEQRRVTHTTKCDDSSWHLDALEDQMMQMTPSGYVGQGSPDRVDALVWALTELALGAENRLVW